MSITSIVTDQDYEDALTRMEQLYNSPVGSPESEEADKLSLLIEDYENENFKIDDLDNLDEPE